MLNEPLTPTEQALAVALLIRARELNNQTVRDAHEVARWHRYVDAFLFDKPGDSPSERYDAPARVEHRKFLDRVFGRFTP